MSKQFPEWISLIVAMGRNGVIGAEGGLPWRLPDDMRWFKQQTMGKPVIMGRKTYESIPERFRPLPGRRNIVLTSNRAFQLAGCTAVHTVEAALAAAGNAPEIMVIGGGRLYEQFFPLANRLYLTLIDADFEGDTYFPPLDWTAWREEFRQVHQPDTRHAFSFTWLILIRR